MNPDRKNCYKCGTELSSANTFTCSGCGRNDLCILHKGPSSGLCSICLERNRKRLIYPTFAVIGGLLLVFSPYLFKAFAPVFVFPIILFLPFWILVESLRPVSTTKKLRRIVMNTLIVAAFMFLALIIAWDLNLSEQNLRVTAGTAPTIFLVVGILLILLGFIYLLSSSLAGLGVKIFNYDYPEEYSLLLKKAGRDPEMVGILKWDLRWITWINFIYGFLFVYLYINSSAV